MKLRSKVAKILGKSSTLILIVLVSALSVGYVSSQAIADRDLASQKAIVCENCIYIVDSGFSKSEVAVKEGSYLEFVTADGRHHNLALGYGLEHHESGPHDESQNGTNTDHADDSSEHTYTSAIPDHDHVSGTESGVFGEDEAWRVQFKQKGTYMIHDHLYPEFTLLVVVY